MTLAVSPFARGTSHINRHSVSGAYQTWVLRDCYQQRPPKHPNAALAVMATQRQRARARSNPPLTSPASTPAHAAFCHSHLGQWTRSPKQAVQLRPPALFGACNPRIPLRRSRLSRISPPVSATAGGVPRRRSFLAIEAARAAAARAAAAAAAASGSPTDPRGLSIQGAVAPPVSPRHAVSSFSPAHATPASLPASTAQTQDKPAAASSFTVSFGGREMVFSRRLMLYLVPMLCSTFVICAKVLYLLPRALSPAAFSAARLVVAASVFIPTLVSFFWRGLFANQRAQTVPTPHRVWGGTGAVATTSNSPGDVVTPAQVKASVIQGVELGTLVFVSNLVQLLGLRFTQASRAAFLNQLQIVLVPVFAALAGHEALSARAMMSALIACAGVGVLTFGGAPVAAAGGSSLSSMALLGDGLEIGAAIIYSIYILRVGAYAAKNPRDIMPIMGIKAVTQALLAFLWIGANKLVALWKGGASNAAGATAAAASSAVASAASAVAAWSPLMIAASVGLVLWCGLMVAVLASWLQMQGQSSVSANEATIIYSSQPLWASAFATLFLGETFGISGLVGAGLIVGGSMLSSSKKS